MPMPADLGTAPPDAGPADWNDDGVLILPGFFHPDQLRDYRREWAAAHGYRGFGLDDELPIIHADRPRGWPRRRSSAAALELTVRYVPVR